VFYGFVVCVYLDYVVDVVYCVCCLVLYVEWVDVVVGV